MKTVTQIRAAFTTWIAKLDDIYDSVPPSDRGEISSNVYAFSESLGLLERSDDSPETTAIANDLYNSSLRQFQALVDVLSLHSLGDSYKEFAEANDKHIEVLNRQIRDLKDLAENGPGFFDTFLQGLKDAFTTIGMGFGAVVGGAIFILLVYLYLKNRK